MAQYPRSMLKKNCLFAGIRREVDEAVEVRVAEVVELWIEAPIVGLHPEVAALDRDAHVARAGESAQRFGAWNETLTSRSFR